MMHKKKEEIKKKFSKIDPKELSNESEKLPKEGLQDSKNLEKGFRNKVSKPFGSPETSKSLDKSETSQKEKIKELTDTLQRLQAEFENYKKRIDKEKNEFVKYSKHELIAKLLPILDSFELAIKNHKCDKETLKGFELIFSQLYSTLQSEGIRPIEALGKRFDPYKHEVLLQEASDKEEDIVLEELQKGYMLNDKVLRHTKVKVAKKEEKKK